MDDPKPDFWFPVKRLGWGWGAPVRWQGWALLGAYIGSLILGVEVLRGTDYKALRFVYVAVVTVLFIVIVAIKGERPLKWRNDS